MSAYRIAQRYAKSLIDLAGERDKIAQVTADIRMINSVLDGSRELRLLLQSPIVKADKKRTVLEAVFRGRVEEETLAFIRILVSKRRESHLEEITTAFIEHYNQRMSITPALLVTAAPILLSALRVLGNPA